ncbi:hypothetical protein CCUS01_17070 [Colletotrichum cuscutae]|uniref:Uncharacterized protein n=2 Tax=Colletotrichum acutatum species complex TaxID=2707335 RepID=A0AAI9Y4B5_9PEZI|nr:uncharacterized protein CTAM01_01571 [Colletotrichum tamarilloi]KAI3537414.1 hypothetical protein CSPX01_10205 [Colletotrichum filicis]KAK1474340.1 hypothetical protein CCUS01_17070 [Colletotrichum cuscutae]KAK1510998.1 hypothetical protein CTAM01_01571 [Colletotrichum tamarilloi]
MWSLRCSCLGHPSELAVHSRGRPARSKLSILRYCVRSMAHTQSY